MPKKPVRRPAKKKTPTRPRAKPGAKSSKKKVAAPAAPSRRPKKKSTEALELSGQQRAYLRGLGHHLDPVVQIGHKGVSAEVLKELDHALVIHELLKVKLLRSAPVTVAEAAKKLGDATLATVAQTIGKVILLYRESPDPDRQRIKLPQPKAASSEDEETPTEDLERRSEEE